jgi:acetyl esterase/lipase
VAPFPAALDDCRAGVRWLRSRAPRYGIDSRRIFAAGGSAGGNLALLLALETQPGAEVSAAAAFNPVVDLVALRDARLGRAVRDYIGVPFEQDPNPWKAASPAYQVHPGASPVLILQGNADATAPYAQSVELVRRLKAAGVPAELFTAPGADHGFFNAPPWYQPALNRMADFFAAVRR